MQAGGSRTGWLLAPLCRRDLVLLGGLALALRLVAAYLIPLGAGPGDPNCAPDEAAHLAYVEELATGRARAWPEIDAYQSVHLPTPYLGHALGLALARGGLDRPWMYRVVPADARLRGFPLARLASVALGVASVLLLALASAWATGARRAGIVLGLAVAFYPQAFFVAAYVNNDAGTLAAGSLLTAALARWMRDGEGDRGLLAVGLAAGAALIAKPSGFPLILSAGGWVGWAVFAARISRRQALRAALAAAVVAVPVLAWNAARTGGDPIGLVRNSQHLALSLRESGGVVLPPDAGWVFARSLVRSSFMQFANMSLGLPVVLYAPWLAILTIGLTAAFAAVRRAGKSPARRAGVWLVASLVLSLGFVAYRSFFADFSPQGRYMLLPVLLLTMVAIWAPVATPGIGPPGGPPARWRRLWLHACFVYLALAGLWSEVLLYSRPCG